MRELDSRLMDIDSGRFDVTLWWDAERNLLYLVARQRGEEQARVRIPLSEGMSALHHPVMYLRDHL